MFNQPRVCGFIALVASTGIMLLSGCSVQHAVAPTPPLAPVLASGAVRETTPNDYLRVAFLMYDPSKPPPIVTNLSRPSLRAFATATPLYSPPLTLHEFPLYSGLENNDNGLLIAMRCRPPHPETVDALLATWPNVFLAIQRDIPPAADCEALSSTPNPDPEKKMACIAKAFNDTPTAAVPVSLAYTFQYAGALFQPDQAALATWLQSKYGIYPAFSGIGYSVKDSYNLSTKQPMSSQEILVKSISSEYLLKNVTLAEAGCRCISVAPYPGRATDPVDPDFIAAAGGDGSCQSVLRLAVEKHPR
jgi:hypothetical protein